MPSVSDAWLIRQHQLQSERERLRDALHLAKTREEWQDIATELDQVGERLGAPGRHPAPAMPLRRVAEPRQRAMQGRQV